MTAPTLLLLLPLFFLFFFFFLFFIVKIKLTARRGGGAEDSRLPPGSKGWPVLGETLQFLGASRRGKPESFIQERMAKYNSRVFRTSLLGENVAVVCGPPGNKFLFGNEGKLVEMWWPSSVRKLFGDQCLINMVGDEARRVRKMMMAFMGPDQALVQYYITAMEDVAHRHFTTQWEEQINIAMSKEPGESLQWEDIQKMRYSWSVVSEIIRIAPPIIGSFREALTDLTYEGYTIPKGWKLYWSAASTHKDPSLFSSPENFDVSRFEEAGTSPFSYVPFGGGPRMCLGKEYARLEILVFLHNLVKRFKWDLVILNEKIEYDPMPTPAKGLLIHLRPH
ncbi:beta-amyrin 28-monooxygenase-like isoform X2 [Malania oleifera]|uniref:beta-amyrin 28-monooxygenase-like isoform X2 n=1 Tax=Malania oleifera TaxID=397392 RepID=UPI0025AE1EBA|nr:beta-amyrin 28-monooxygenase-like isoform X2 [Malania oleifera]